MDDITKLNNHIVSGQGRYRLDRCEIDAGWSLKVLESIRIQRDTALAERLELGQQLRDAHQVIRQLMAERDELRRRVAELEAAWEARTKRREWAEFPG